MELVSLKVISGLLNVVAAFLHALGAYLFLCIHKTGNDKPEVVYLINLSLSEMLVALCGTLSVICSSIEVGTYLCIGNSVA